MKRPIRIERSSVRASLKKPPRRQDRSFSDEALSLIEVMVALVILLIAMIPMGYMLDSAVTGAATARQREAALQLADSWMEILTNSTPPTQPNTTTVITGTWSTAEAQAGAQTPKSTLAGTTFTVQVRYEEQLVNNIGTQSDLCSSGEPPSSNHPGVIELRGESDLGPGSPDPHRRHQHRLPPAWASSTDGFLAVQLTNDSGTDNFR